MRAVSVALILKFQSVISAYWEQVNSTDNLFKIPQDDGAHKIRLEDLLKIHLVYNVYWSGLED